MAFFLSPGVFVREKDLSQIIPAVATSTSAIVGASDRGPAFQRTLVTSDQQFRDLFGDPNPTKGFMHYSALAFLKDGNQLYVTRVHNGALHSGVVLNSDAAAAGSAVLTIGEDDPTSFDFAPFTDSLFSVFAENPGVWGDSLSVKITNTNVTAGTFDIEVYQLQNGNTVLVETHTVSRTAGLDGFGQQLFLEDRINGKSVFITVKNNAAAASSLLPKSTVTAEVLGIGNGTLTAFAGNFANVPVQPFSVSITDTVEVFTDDGFGNLSGDLGGSGTLNYSTGAFSVTFTTAPITAQNIEADYALVIEASFTLGSDGAAVTDSNLITGWELYRNPDDVDVRILIGGGAVTVPVQLRIKEICEDRLDCIGVLDVPSANQGASSALSWRRNVQNINSSYTALYGPNVRIFDEFNDIELLVPPSGYAAGVYARTDEVTDPWFAPAGLRRGQLSILGLDTRYTQGERDLLYPNGINPIRVFPGQGTVVWGQRTQQAEASALDRVNVRRLLIVLEKSISIALLSDVFELNDSFTRLLIKQKIDEFLQRVQDRRGLQEFRTVVDGSNNGSAVIDANQMNVDIFLKPARAAEFIQLTAVITRSGASFDELIAGGALSA